MNRRSVLICLAASAAAGVAHTPALAALTAPRFPCGCASQKPIGEFDGCLVHDEKGKRWDAYTLEDVCKANRDKIATVGPRDAWSCACGEHEALEDLPVGTRGVWRQASYEYDEWEFRCEASEIADFVMVQTTDWDAMARELA